MKKSKVVRVTPEHFEILAAIAKEQDLRSPTAAAAWLISDYEERELRAEEV
jgi:hypothetical protein